MPVIQVENLCKSYGRHQVLHNVDLSVADGKLVGFLGPNGAGKTTTIRILLGLLASDSGRVEIFDLPTLKSGRQIRSDIGYLPGDVHFYPNLTGRQTLSFMAGARRKSTKEEVDRLAERFDLHLNKRVRRYSTGMRQKLGLIQAMAHKPKLLILDEPTSALDPLIRQSVFDELRNVVKEGRTVLFSSHSLNEVEELCDEVVILREGRVVEQESIDVLRQRAIKRIEITFKNSPPINFPEPLQVISALDRVIQATWANGIDELLTWIRDLEIEDLIIERPDLNDLFITYYSGSNG